MKFLQRQVTTLKDSQRLGRLDRLEVYLTTVNNLERLPTTLSFYLCYMETNKIPLTTANDPERRQRLAVSKFGAKSSNLNERL